MGWDLEYDAVLVGGGLGSLSAAIRLAEAGLRPLLVEKSACVGGGGAYSGGIVWAPDNHRMRAKSIPDSADAGLTYLKSIAQGRWDPGVARAYVETVPAALAWLEARTSVKWTTYPGLPDYFAELPGGTLGGRCLLPHGDLATPFLDRAARRWPEMARVRRSIHFPGRHDAWSGGRALVGHLWARVLEDGTDHWFDSRATSLSKDGDGVAGVVVDGPHGRRRIGARLGVLLNTGGFEWDELMTRRHIPAAEVHPQTPPSNEGDGHLMAAELGAAFALMDQTIWMPSVLVPGEDNDGRPLYRLFFQELALPHSLVVNRAGRRFANETFFQDVARGWTLSDTSRSTFPNLPSFFIFDGQYREHYGLPAPMREGEYRGGYESLADLASARGIDGAPLQREIDRFNDAARSGRDPRFHRGATAYQRAFADLSVSPNPTLGTLEQPPFYCLELHPGTSGHRGGVVTDERARVLDVRARRIRGLYACGNTAAGLVTGASYITGTSIGHSIAFGALAAEDMVTNHARCT